MPYLPITEAESIYLNKLSRAAGNYRQALRLKVSIAQQDLHLMEQGKVPLGPQHQVMHEVTKYYGEVDALMSIAWTVFTQGQDEEERFSFVERVKGYLTTALSEDTTGRSVGGQHWFMTDAEKTA